MITWVKKILNVALVIAAYYARKYNNSSSAFTKEKDWLGDEKNISNKYDDYRRKLRESSDKKNKHP